MLGRAVQVVNPLRLVPPSVVSSVDNTRKELKMSGYVFKVQLTFTAEAFDRVRAEEKLDKYITEWAKYDSDKGVFWDDVEWDVVAIEDEI